MSKQKNLTTLSLLTFNTLGTPVFAPDISKRYRRAAHLINTGDFDIVCLQEIFTYYHLYIFKTILSNFPYVVYQKNVPGPRGGLVIFSKYKLVNPRFITFSYPQKAYVPLYVRIAMQGILTAELEGSFMQLMTTHLSSDTTSYLTTENKLYALIKSESEETANLVNTFLYKKRTVILAGDFNIAKHTDIYKTFLHKTKLTDLFDKDEAPTYYPDRVSYFYNAPKARIDYIFAKSARKSIKILKTDVTFMEKEMLSGGKKSFLSDHIGLHCTLEVNE